MLGVPRGGVPILFARAPPARRVSRIEHQVHSYCKSKKVLDNTSAPVKSSVHVNGGSNRRGVWRVNYEYVVVFH